jgi:hypothetical protein
MALEVKMALKDAERVVDILFSRTGVLYQRSVQPAAVEGLCQSIPNAA